ncbi:Immunoglobulin-like fold [Phytophthora cactorum]|nr:Immunoglobulin-like fold [Phytophthora cactorum]
MELPLHAAVTALNHSEGTLDESFELLGSFYALYPSSTVLLDHQVLQIATHIDEPFTSIEWNNLCYIMQRRPPLYYAIEQHWGLEKLSWLVDKSLDTVLEKDSDGLSVVTHARMNACPEELVIRLAVLPHLVRDLPETLFPVIQSFVEVALVAKGEPLNYQWFVQQDGQDDGIPIDGATQSFIFISPSIQPHNEGVYYCEIANRVGRVVSTRMVVRVVDDRVPSDPTLNFVVDRALLTPGGHTMHCLKASAGGRVTTYKPMQRSSFSPIFSFAWTATTTRNVCVGMIDSFHLSIQENFSLSLQIGGEDRVVFRWPAPSSEVVVTHVEISLEKLLSSSGADASLDYPAFLRFPIGATVCKTPVQKCTQANSIETKSSDEISSSDFTIFERDWVVLIPFLRDAKAVFDAPPATPSIVERTNKYLVLELNPASESQHEKGYTTKSKEKSARRTDEKRTFSPYFYVVEMAVFSPTFWRRYDQTWWFDKTRLMSLMGCIRSCIAGLIQRSLYLPLLMQVAYECSSQNFRDLAELLASDDCALQCAKALQAGLEAPADNGIPWIMKTARSHLLIAVGRLQEATDQATKKLICRDYAIPCIYTLLTSKVTMKKSL